MPGRKIELKNVPLHVQNKRTIVHIAFVLLCTALSGNVLTLGSKKLQEKNVGTSWEQMQSLLQPVRHYLLHIFGIIINFW